MCRLDIVVLEQAVTQRLSLNNWLQETTCAEAEEKRPVPGWSRLVSCQLWPCSLIAVDGGCLGQERTSSRQGQLGQRGTCAGSAGSVASLCKRAAAVALPATSPAPRRAWHRRAASAAPGMPSPPGCSGAARARPEAAASHHTRTFMTAAQRSCSRPGGAEIGNADPQPVRILFPTSSARIHGTMASHAQFVHASSSVAAC